MYGVARAYSLQRSRGWITPETSWRWRWRRGTSSFNGAGAGSPRRRLPAGVPQSPCGASTEPGLDHPGDHITPGSPQVRVTVLQRSRGWITPETSRAANACATRRARFNGAGAGSPRRRLPPSQAPARRQRCFNGAGAGSPRRLCRVRHGAVERVGASTEPGLDHPGDSANVATFDATSATLQRSRGWITPETCALPSSLSPPPASFNGAGAGSPRRPRSRLAGRRRAHCGASTEPGLDHPGDLADARVKAYGVPPLQRSRGWITPETSPNVSCASSAHRFNGAGAGSPRRPRILFWPVVVLRLQRSRGWITPETAPTRRQRQSR